jgi:hypothetical protein
MEWTRRGYNQAFFKKLDVLPEWDDDQAQTVVRIIRSELTEPYAALLADGMAAGVLAEAEAIKRASNAKDGPGGEPPSADVSYYERMAERAGFEPAMELLAPYSLSRRVPSATRPPLLGAGQPV